jgi:hypothetical protein
MAQIDVTDDGHWLWRGRRNFAGSPVVETHGGNVMSAHLYAADIFGLKVPARAELTCDHDSCVRPACWRLPVAAKAATRRVDPQPKAA